MENADQPRSVRRPGPAVVIIPARGGSVGVPLKNLEQVGGVSLVGRAVRTALAARGVGQVVVSTDHPRIAEEARRHGARVVERPADLAGSTATSESAVLHALDALAAQDAEGTSAATDPMITVLVQCTSPFISPADLDAAISAVAGDEHDVVLSVAQSFDFQWRTDSGGSVHAVGHRADHRPRRQDRDPHYRETGAFYVMDTAGLRRAGHRFFGRIGLQQVDPHTAIEIDTVTELELARLLAQSVTPLDALDVDAVITDFDGVHTDDHAQVSADGTEHVRVHRGDGLGVAALRRAGVPLLILSTERNAVVAARADKLGVDVRHGVDDKATVLREWVADHGLDPDRVAYVGNDVNDLPALALVGWPVAVADAHPAVLAAARLVLDRRGGDGAVRELCDRVLRARTPPTTETDQTPMTDQTPLLHPVA